MSCGLLCGAGTLSGGSGETGAACIGCQVSAGEIEPPGGRHLITPRFSLHARLDGARVFIVQSVDHHPDLASLGAGAGELGQVLAALTAARGSTGARILYVGVFNETRPQHLHARLVAVQECVGEAEIEFGLVARMGCACGTHPHPATQSAALAAASRSVLAGWEVRSSPPPSREPADSAER